MIENVSTQLTVFHCFAHCLLPGRAFASLYVLLFLEKEAEIGGRVHVPLKYFFLFCYLIRLIDSAIGYVRNLFIAHLYNSTLILQPSATNRNCPIPDLKTRLTTPVEFPADLRKVLRNSFHFRFQHLSGSLALDQDQREVHWF